MFLTEAEKQRVHAEAPDIPGTAEELISQAFEAILHGQADEVAYSVTRAAGVEWLTPSIWYKERPQVNAEQARAILKQGKKDGTHEAPIPEDDKKAIADAEELIEMAQTAWDQMLRGPEVEIILKMAADAQDGTQPERQDPPEKTPPEPEPEEPKSEEPAPEPQEPQAEGDAGDLSNVEPWENYDRERVSDIKAGINAAVREYSDDDLMALMANVWAYEAAHKNRETVLKHLETVAQRLQDGGEIPEDPPDASNDAPMDDDDVVPGEGTPEPQQAEVEAEPQPEEAPKEETPEPEQEKPEPEQEKPEEEKPKRQRRQREERQGEGSGDDEYDKLMKQVEDELERDRLHKPEHPDEEIPNLPWDWTKMSDKELQRFHGIYSSVAYYKSYQLSRDERMALHCKAAADELHNALIVALEKYDEHGKEKKVAVVEAEVESDENIKKWRRRQRKHETFAASHRNEMNSMSKLVEALSRHESMRQQEWERSGGKMGRKG